MEERKLIDPGVIPFWRSKSKEKFELKTIDPSCSPNSSSNESIPRAFNATLAVKTLSFQVPFGVKRKVGFEGNSISKASSKC